MRKLLIRICRSVLLIGGFAALSFVGVEGRALCQTPQAPTQPTTVILDAAQDARLTKSFRLEARSQTLASLLQQLGEKSDVHLRVEAEWIGELRVNAFTRPLPLHRLLQRLAQAHNLSWRKQLPAVVTTSGNPPADAQPEYILYESEINRRYVALLKRRSWEPLRKDLEQLRSYVALSQEELERLARNGDALAARFKEPRERASAALKTALSESDLETLIGSKQRNLTYTFDQLTPAAKTALTFFAQERWERSKQNLKIALAQGANVPPAAYEPPKMEEYRVMYSLEGQGTGAESDGDGEKQHERLHEQRNLHNS